MKSFFLIFYILLIIPLISACSGNETNSKANPFSTPTGVSATDGYYNDRIVITWNAVSGASSYNIYRSTSETGPFTKIGWASSSETSASNSKTSPTGYEIEVNTTYYYAITAVDSSNHETDRSL